MVFSDGTLAYAEEVTSALLGVDALYRAEAPGDDEGLVVVNMSTSHQPEAFSGYAEADARFAALEDRAGRLAEPDRRIYYRQLCVSTRALIQWRLGQLPFAGQLERFLHVPTAPAGDSELDSLRSEMHALLSSMGYDGDVSDQCSAWQARTRVPADEVPGVLGALLDEAWERTAARMSLPAPKSDGMRVAAVSGVPFNARCDYLSRTVELNIDPVLTRPALKHLAVHEGYPGHYVQFKLRETWYREGKAPADGLLSIVNSASSCTFEGIADNGLRVIDWIENDDDRLQTLLTRYQSGVGTAAAWRLHALQWPVEQVTDWLGTQSLVGGEGWAKNRMGFIAAPQRAALIWSYWWGDATVGPIWEQVPEGRRAEFLQFLYGRMHSLQSVAMFQ